ncbi:vWA domain-containing protein [Alicyclobacillus cellulosilyticus]|uniref:vWA domain-containing protein n=1 Tax=Alicyclobacillus cellulosilyticus TaxID=1003997 RepID=UPI001E2AE572|nr:vWA domain-containing protein [Alicyclobacillus cellulosilyticus]
MTAKQGVIRQVLVITDGCSNVGEDPVACAERARRAGVIVNVIGVVDQGEIGRQGQMEAMSIADAGGGMCRIVRPSELSATAQMVTHQTMQMTLQQVVHQQLLQVVGKPAEDLTPAERARVMQVVDRLEEEVGLEMVVAIDVSASMKDKMPTVREAIRDLALSLQVRQGPFEVAVIAFPGDFPGNEESPAAVRVVQPFQPQLDADALARVLVARGGTPTGPAILRALELFSTKQAEPGFADLPERRWTGETGT